jgi:predicted ATP-grasp superfamily ATP-dependent carboligase
MASAKFIALVRPDYRAKFGARDLSPGHNSAGWAKGVRIKHSAAGAYIAGAMKRTWPAEAVVCIGDSGINALATVRSLGRRGIPVHAVAFRSSPQIASASRYCRSVTAVENDGALYLVLGALGERFSQPPVLYVDNDAMMRLLAPHVGALREQFRIVDAIGDSPRLTDKAFQTRFAAEAGIAVPRSWFPRTWEELHELSRETARPLIAKPSPSRFHGTSRPDFKAIIARSAAELARQLRAQASGPQQILVQEFIEGDDAQIYAGLCYRAKSHDRCFVLSARKLRQTVPGAGVMAVGEVVDAPHVREMTRSLAQKLDLRGVICTEFKFNREDARYYFIEWNPRPAYFHSLGWKAGFDLAFLAYCDHVCPDELEVARGSVGKNHYWINFHGDLMHFSKAPQRALAVSTWLPYLRRPQWAVFALDDLAPWARSTKKLAAWLWKLMLRAGTTPISFPALNRRIFSRARSA